MITINSLPDFELETNYVGKVISVLSSEDESWSLVCFRVNGGCSYNWVRNNLDGELKQ